MESDKDEQFANPKLLLTEDGSHTLYHAELNETYHSRHGAVQESQHIFIKNGLDHFINQNPEIAELNLLEVGLGTGLNAFLTYLCSQKNPQLKINYIALEAYPAETEITKKLNYAEVLDQPKAQSIFSDIHICSWDEKHDFSENFSFIKHKTKLQDFSSEQLFDVVYFDAFAPQTQPELWTAEIFGNLYKYMAKNALLTTYCAKGQVRRNMQAAGFGVERLAGPPGKREILRAKKNK